MNRYSYQKIYHLLFNLKKSLETYPPNLIIFIKNGNLFTNTNRPYLFWLKENERKRLLVSFIETADKQTVDNLHSLVIFAKDQVFIKNPNNYQVISGIKLSEISELNINKETINQTVTILDSFLNNLYRIYLLFIFLLVLTLPLLSFSINSIYLLIASFFVYCYFKFLKRRHFHLKKVFQISLHAITFPITLEYLMVILPVNSVNFFSFKNQFLISFPFVFPILIILVFIVFTAIGVWEAYNNKYSDFVNTTSRSSKRKS